MYLLYMSWDYWDYSNNRGTPSHYTARSSAKVCGGTTASVVAPKPQSIIAPERRGPEHLKSKRLVYLVRLVGYLR